jgi:hypothetical protein
MGAVIGGPGDAIQRLRDQMAGAQLARPQAQGADSDRAGTFHPLSLTSLLSNNKDPEWLPSTVVAKAV